MKFVVFGDARRVGAWVGDRIVDLAAADPDRSLPSDLLGLIRTGRPGLDAAGRAVAAALDGRAPAGAVLARDRVELHAPWPGKRIACAGGNFPDHLLGMLRNLLGRPDATLEQAASEARAAGQWGFWKVPSEVIGPGGEIRYPHRARYFDYEGEVAIVLGRDGRDIAASDWADHVWGVTLLNDGSIRDPGGAPRFASYNLAKNFDGATAVGPCIVVDELRADDLIVETRVNGRLRQRFNAGDMIFSWGEILEHLSRDLTLVAGDLVSGGTGAGTAADQSAPGPDRSPTPDLFLHPGDTLEISSAGIGRLDLTVA